jgi:hypothetical protein
MQAQRGIDEFRLCYLHLLIQPLEDLVACDFEVSISEICSSHKFQPHIFEMPLMSDLNRHLR